MGVAAAYGRPIRAAIYTRVLWKTLAYLLCGNDTDRQRLSGLASGRLRTSSGWVWRQLPGSCQCEFKKALASVRIYRSRIWLHLSRRLVYPGTLSTRNAHTDQGGYESVSVGSYQPTFVMLQSPVGRRDWFCLCLLVADPVAAQEYTFVCGCGQCHGFVRATGGTITGFDPTARPALEP
jgi:hypothetical protein